MNKYGFGKVKVRKATPNNGYPEGFDMSLDEVFEKYNLNEDQLNLLRDMHKDKQSGLAYATVGRRIFYRKSQIEQLFGL